MDKVMPNDPMEMIKWVDDNTNDPEVVARFYQRASILATIEINVTMQAIQNELAVMSDRVNRLTSVMENRP